MREPLKPGDLCLIIGGGHRAPGGEACLASVGRVVVVVAQRFLDPLGRSAWWYESPYTCAKCGTRSLGALELILMKLNDGPADDADERSTDAPKIADVLP
jgi:hypothetical protein